MTLIEQIRERIALCLFLFAALIVLLVLLFGTGRPSAQPTVNLPFATVAAVTNASSQIIGANPSRRAIQICTAGNTTTFTIAPAPIVPVAATNGFVLLGTATASTCFTSPKAVGVQLQGGAGAAWNAIGSVAGPTNLIVLEW